METGKNIHEIGFMLTDHCESTITMLFKKGRVGETLQYWR